jgi:HAD superfamily hydrolase (TIGR01509 family)
VPEAVIFDLDGVLLDSEQRWNDAKEALVAEAGGTWRDEAARTMMGMSSPEWVAYLRDELGVPWEAERVNREVVRRMREGYAEGLPLLPGALECVRALAERWPLGLASSSNRELIDLFLDVGGVRDLFRATVSSEEVARGKPAPDVYVAAARGVGADPARCVAIEDSENGMRAAHAAGLTIVAVPNPHYPPDEEALTLAAASVAAPGDITPALVARVAPD